MTAPKLFISYSWSSPEHEQWVLDLATELRQSGVDAILDKWDLREGHDAIAFMEKMVSDPEIKKVAIICDEKYAMKAVGRAGGVGTETQIISKEVYENQSQEKFVAVVCDMDSNGKPFLPTYYKSRIYIDLSDDQKRAENFEQLLRWALDKPLYRKPDIGNLPSFLSEGTQASLGTSAAFRRCLEAIKNQKSYAHGAFDEYCETFAANLERFRLTRSEGEFDDLVISNISDFLPYRNEVIQLMTAIAQYSPGDFIQQIHRFLEDLIPYLDCPPKIKEYRDRDFDNYKFIIHELFLYAATILIKHDRLEQVNHLLQTRYYIRGHSQHSYGPTTNFTVFQQRALSLEDRKRRLRLSAHSLHADLLKARCDQKGIEFDQLVQTDFIAFIRSRSEREGYSYWYPETLINIEHPNSPLEVFARSSSKAYFERAKILLAIAQPDDLRPIIMNLKDDPGFQGWSFLRFNPIALLGYEQLATRP